MRPLVSIIMAMRNAEQSVRAAIESVQFQTMRDWELIVVDDDSTDRSASIVDELAENDPRIRLVRSTPRRRPASARNCALDLAGGRFIHFLDADDVITLDALELLLASATDTGASCGGWRITTQDGSPIDSGRTYSPDTDVDLDRRLDGHSFPIHAQIIRRDLLADHRFDTSLEYCEDGELFTRLAALGVVWRAFRIPVAEYRQRPRKRGLAHAQAFRKAWTSAYRFARDVPRLQKRFDLSEDRERRFLNDHLLHYTHLLLLDQHDSDPATVASQVGWLEAIDPQVAAEAAHHHLPFSEMRSPDAWNEHAERYWRATGGWWRHCEREGWARPGFVSEARRILLWLIADRLDAPGRAHIPTAIARKLDPSRRVVLLGFGRNARRLARELHSNGFTLAVRDHGLTARQIRAAADGIPIEVQRPRSRYDRAAQHVMTLLHDDSFMARLPAGLVDLRWREAANAIAEPIRRRFDSTDQPAATIVSRSFEMVASA